MKHTFLLFSFLLLCTAAQAQIITTIAGNGGSGYNGDNIPATDAWLNEPAGIVTDSVGNLYISDRMNNRIRKIHNGIITTIAGTGVPGYNGDSIQATDAKIYYPTGIAVDSKGMVYFGDQHNMRIRLIDTNGIITTIAGVGFSFLNPDTVLAKNAYIEDVHGIYLYENKMLYWAGASMPLICKIDLTNGIMTRFAGKYTSNTNCSGDSGQVLNAGMTYPFDVMIDNKGRAIISDYNCNDIRCVDTNGIINTIAGIGGHYTFGFSGDDSAAINARLYRPAGIVQDGTGSLFISDQYNQRIRKIDTAGIITTFAGNGTATFNGDDITATSASLNYPSFLATDKNNNLYISDLFNNRIRFIRNTTGLSGININNANISIFPNPTTNGYCNFIVNTTHRQEVRIYIKNILGEQVKYIETVTNLTTRIETTQLPPGLYLVYANIEGQAFVDKLLISNN